MLKRFFGLIGLCVAGIGGAQANCVSMDEQRVPTLAEIAEIIENKGCTKGQVEYEVYLPSAPNPVTYNITLESVGADDDTLNVCEYLIDWKLPRKGGESTGFSAYYDGHHFRYRDLKLQEYHVADDPRPFEGEKGVQRQAQFTDLLAPHVAKKFREMAGDPAYSYTIRRSGDALTVSGTQSVQGYEALQFDYTLDGMTMMPRKTDFVYNPASISEQNVTATYTWESNPECVELTEDLLRDRYPDVFAKYRKSNFHVRSLVGQTLPEITALTADRGRYQRAKGDGFIAPTLFVFMDPKVGSARATVKSVREAVNGLPFQADVVYIFADNDTEEVYGLLGELDSNETALISGKSAIADCGITAYPTILFCDRQGMVKDIEIGANNNLADVVLQKTTLSN